MLHQTRFGQITVLYKNIVRKDSQAGLRTAGITAEKRIHHNDRRTLRDQSVDLFSRKKRRILHNRSLHTGSRHHGD